MGLRPNKLTPGYNVRWESMRMILPEWREMYLADQEERRKVEPPLIDEQLFEEYSEIMHLSMEDNDYLQFTYWKDGHYHETIAFIHRIDQIPPRVQVVDTNHQNFFIPLMHIKYVGWS